MSLGHRTFVSLLLALSVYLLVPVASADTINYTISGVFVSHVPPTPFVANNASFTVTFSFPGNPVVFEVFDDTGFKVIATNATYLLNGNPVPFTSSEVDFATRQLGGLFDLFFTSGEQHVFILLQDCSFSSQLFTGPISAPTLIPAHFSSLVQPFCSKVNTGSGVLATGALLSADISAVSAVPEPSSLLLLSTGMLGILGAVRKLRCFGVPDG